MTQQDRMDLHSTMDRVAAVVIILMNSPPSNSAPLRKYSESFSVATLLLTFLTCTLEESNIIVGGVDMMRIIEGVKIRYNHFSPPHLAWAWVWGWMASTLRTILAVMAQAEVLILGKPLPQLDLSMAKKLSLKSMGRHCKGNFKICLFFGGICLMNDLFCLFVAE